MNPKCPGVQLVVKARGREAPREPHGGVAGVPESQSPVARRVHPGFLGLQAPHLEMETGPAFPPGLQRELWQGLERQEVPPGWPEALLLSPPITTKTRPDQTNQKRPVTFLRGRQGSAPSRQSSHSAPCNAVRTRPSLPRAGVPSPSLASGSPW